MKKYLALFLIALMAVSIIGAAGVVCVAAAAKTPKSTLLDAPIAYSPKNNAIFYATPSGPVLVRLEWYQVYSASTYNVEVQKLSDTGVWQVYLNQGGIVNPYAELDGSPGAYRWHVQAIPQMNPASASPWSQWRTFTVGDVRQLATPTLVSPKNGATLAVNSPVTFTWKPVDNARIYKWEVQSLSDTGVWGVYDWGYTFAGDPTTYPSSFWLQGTYRWHVIAINSDYFVDSDGSGWNTFTVV